MIVKGYAIDVEIKMTLKSGRKYKHADTIHIRAKESNKNKQLAEELKEIHGMNTQEEYVKIMAELETRVREFTGFKGVVSDARLP